MTGDISLVAQELGAAERLALAYAPAATRSAVAGFLLLDAQLARIAFSSREAVLAQLKLAWWRDACADLAVPQSQPLVELLARDWVARSEPLAGLIDAWEEFAVSEDGTASAAESVAEARAIAFASAVGATVDHACRGEARCWTLVALANHAPNASKRAAMLDTAGAIASVALPRSLRPLAVLAGLARRARRRRSGALLGDRVSPLAAIRLGIFGR